MEAVVLHRVGFLEYFCPKQGQDFKPSVASLYPIMRQVPPPHPRALSVVDELSLVDLAEISDRFSEAVPEEFELPFS